MRDEELRSLLSNSCFHCRRLARVGGSISRWHGAMRKSRDNGTGLRDDDWAPDKILRKGTDMSHSPTGLSAPTPDERSMGLLVHVLSIFTGFWAPLIIYIVKRDSKFISFHALQSLLWHLLYMIVSFIFVFGMIFVFMGTVISRVAAQHGPGAAPPPGIFL